MQKHQAGGPAPNSGGSARSPEIVAIRVALVAIAAAAALFLLWQTAGVLLLVFAGLLLASLLDGCARLGDRWIGLRRGWSLALTIVGLVAGTAGILFLGGYNLVAEADALLDHLSDAIETWRGELEVLGMEPDDSGDGAAGLLQSLVPDPEQLFERVQTAFGTVFGILGDMIVILFVGIFAAAQPAHYARGVVSLFPAHRRPRIASVLAETGHVMRWWLLGQFCAMTLIGLTTWAAMAVIGLPSAALLGLQAGLFSFIPYLGPILGGVPIGLVALGQGWVTLLWAIGVYAVIQTIEGYLMTPLIQRRAVHLPPLLGILAMVLFGALFGVIGVALATPLVAVIRLLVLRLYVEDALGGPAR
ncbi:MAG: AI-2E family transporter [Alphaproteobacteria bacterium]